MEPFMVDLYLQQVFESMAIAAEIEAMKAANQERLSRGEAQVYDEEAFREKAQQLWALQQRTRLSNAW